MLMIHPRLRNGFPPGQIYFLLLTIFLLSACSLPARATPWAPPAVPTTQTLLPPSAVPTSTPPGAPPTHTAPPPTASPTQTEAAAPTPSLPPPEIPRPRYRLEASLDYADHRLEVSQHITYTNTTEGPLTELPLVVEARRYPGVFDLERLEWSDGSRISQFYWTDTLLTVLLPQPVPPGEVLNLRLDYELFLFDSSKKPNSRPYPLGYTSHQANLGDWYPFIPPYRPDLGWQVHKPWFYGEHLVYGVADFEVAIRSVGQVKDVVIAASAPAQPSGEWQLYRHEQARSFAWSASPFYQVITQTVALTGSPAVTAASYYLPIYAEAGRSLMETMSAALSLYSDLFGAYPRPLFSAVQAEFLDGMEYDGLFFLGANFYDWYKEDPAQFLTLLGAHETAHQWWYGIVGNDPALEPWLDEALCTYSERLYYEKIAPQALQWWWDYRIHYYQPAGWIDMTIYDAPNETGHYRQYRDTVYLNGALFFEDLRLLVGDEAFFSFLRDYAAKFAHMQASAGEFFALLRQHTSTDLSSLLQKYFRSPP